jgi:hypothetical protein
MSRMRGGGAGQRAAGAAGVAAGLGGGIGERRGGAADGAMVNSDEWSRYRPLTAGGRGHASVSHDAGGTRAGRRRDSLSIPRGMDGIVELPATFPVQQQCV